MALLREPLLLLSRSGMVKQLVSTMPVSAGIVKSYVPGESTDSAVEATRGLVDDGLKATLDFLGEDTLDVEQADATVAAYVDLLKSLSSHGLSRNAEVSVKLSAIGQALPDVGHKTALEHARSICRAARNAGTTVTLDMEDHTTTDSTLSILRELRKDFPETGAVLQAYLHRTEADCRALAYEGSRVRLCKGAYNEPDEVAYQSRLDVDRSYIRCLKILLAGQGYPMIASHDPRIVEIASSLASRYGRAQGSYEFQMLYGIRPEEQRRLAKSGETMRVYVPYGQEWYGYLMRRLAERPQNLSFFVKSARSPRNKGKESMPQTAILGAGVMGETLLSGLVRAGRRVDDLLVGEKRPERARELEERYGVLVVSNLEAARKADTLALVVKPQDMGDLLDEIAPELRSGQLVVSLAAGITTAFIEARVPDGVAVVRVMPNTPALVDEGMAAISPGSHCDDHHLAEAEELMGSTGRVLRVPERQMDAVTAISGSGPAYIFFVVESMIEAGVHLGLPRATATDLVVQTLVGSAKMLRETGTHPVVLREQVTSPGGTTAAALRELETHKVRAAFLAAMEAARDRSRSLAEGI